METITVVSISLKIVLTLFFIFYIIFPQKYPAKKLAANPTKLRWILGAAVTFLLGAVGLNIYAHQMPTTMKSSTGLTEDQKSKIALLEERINKKLETYPDSIKKSSWAKSCQEINAQKALELSPNLPHETALLLSMASCSCMMQNLQGQPEFKKSEELIASGKSFENALNEAFANSPEIVEKIQPCTEL